MGGLGGLWVGGDGEQGFEDFDFDFCFCYCRCVGGHGYLFGMRGV